MTLPAPTINDDPRRLAALRSLDLDGSPPDRLFDALAAAAASVCRVPIAHVVLLDEHRQWIIGSVGVPTIRKVSSRCVFSSDVVATGRTLVVPDASLDDRFAGHPLVTGPYDARFYTGVPIHCGLGVTLGALCVVDHVPRRLARPQRLALRRLAAVASRALATRAASVQRIAASRHESLHDRLTGLSNRVAFESALAGALSPVEPGITPRTLLYLDLDRFRIVNDTCGHAAGDRLLRQIGEVVSACIGANDRVARLGADEFGVLLADSDVLRAGDVAQDICDRLETLRFVHLDQRFRIGASIGVVPLEAGWPNVAALLQAADASCRAAKVAGRNRVHVWQRSDTAVATRRDEMRWVDRIERALDEDRLVLHGQRIEPIGAQVDAPIGGLHLEVLLRVREDDGTLTLPGQFLPIAERFQLAPRIDRWVVRHAFEAMERAARDDIAIGLMAINLSGQTLGDLRFHHDLLAMLRTATFDVSTLCLEITETAAVTHLSDACAFIDDVRAFGVKVALDDFGSGASSFGYLKSFPVDFLKIDGHFMTHLLDDPIDRAAVRCFSEIAQAKGIRTIAEFVEADPVREALRTLGIDFVQGHLIHRPEPLAALLARLEPGDRLLEETVRPMSRERRVTEVPFDLPNPNRLAIDDRSEALLWADDLAITVERLGEIVAIVGPMRAAIRAYVMAERRAAIQIGVPLTIRDC